MKCDPDPVACQPCRQKNLKCYTTDRVTGTSKERGQSDRVESELLYLRDQVARYRRRYGSITDDSPSTPYSASVSSSLERNLSVLPSRSGYEHKSNTPLDIPSSQYIGWPTSTNEFVYGPVDGTKVDVLEWGTIDTSDFDCEIMREPAYNAGEVLNFSTGSMTKTFWHERSIPEPLLPPKDETLTDAHIFFIAIWGFVPVLHKPTFMALIHRVYDHPETVSLAEKVQVFQMLAITAQQSATRNFSLKDKMERSFRFLHFSLHSCAALLQERSLPAMQALSLILIQFRSLPKPGCSWNFSQRLLTEAVDMDYHRDPDKIELPLGEQNPLAKELRKRVFHAILGICVTTGCRIGRPSPWQFDHWDIPLPMAIKDSEISIDGVQPELSGQCDFWPCIQLAKLLPLITELFNYIHCVRRRPPDYVKIVEALKTKIEAWREDWDTCIGDANEDKSSAYLLIFTLHIDNWAAEFLLNLHHPSVCTLRTPEMLEKNLDVCHKAARRLLSNAHTLSRKYKAVDFTWHSTVAYALGFGVTLHIYKRRIGSLTQEQFSNMKNDFAGWQNLMAYADLVLQTNNYLQKRFSPIVAEVQGQHEKYLVADTVNGEHKKYSLSHVNAMTKTGIKTESNPTTPSNSTTGTNGHTPQAVGIPQHLQQNYHSSMSFSSGVSATSSPYPMYSPGTTQYTALPTSLAPLLNDPGPTNLVRYQTPSASMPQDMLTTFQPQWYTASTGTPMWPIIAEEPFAS